MQLHNVINGELVPVGKGESFTVANPATGEILTQFSSSTPVAVDAVLTAASTAFAKWSSTTVKYRSQILFKFRSLCLEKYREELVSLIVLENGKHKTDATASFLKGIETLEFALSPTLGSGSLQEVSTGVTCADRRDPVGILVSICPFNFPAMVPMWTIPILLVLGNCVVVKPSEKVPFTVTRLTEIFSEAGLPPGVLSVVHGGRSVVESLIADIRISGCTFVGSTPVAELVYAACVSAGKRAICLGGAKNHLVLLPDADPDQSSTDILNSFAGSAGQRCMAASVLVIVGDAGDAIVDLVVEKAGSIKPGQAGVGEIGPLIDQAAVERIGKYVAQSETVFGAKVRLDGRSWNQRSAGFWFGPTVLEHTNLDDPAITEEIFGPVLSVIRVPTLAAAIARINQSPFGNAACIYTRSGPCADTFTKLVNVGMIGVNVGVPVPREPFSFGGTKRSKFGIGDITGDGLVEFGTVRRKVTVKWGKPPSDTDFVAKNFTG